LDCRLVCSTPLQTLGVKPAYRTDTGDGKRTRRFPRLNLDSPLHGRIQNSTWETL
jgi:hypothetical protein